jgi:hypothetical protein
LAAGFGREDVSGAWSSGGFARRTAIAELAILISFMVLEMSSHPIIRGLVNPDQLLTRRAADAGVHANGFLDGNQEPMAAFNDLDV